MVSKLTDLTLKDFSAGALWALDMCPSEESLKQLLAGAGGGCSLFLCISCEPLECTFSPRLRVLTSHIFAYYFFYSLHWSRCSPQPFALSRGNPLPLSSPPVNLLRIWGYWEGFLPRRAKHKTRKKPALPRRHFAHHHSPAPSTATLPHNFIVKNMSRIPLSLSYFPLDPLSPPSGVSSLFSSALQVPQRSPETPLRL